MILIFHQTSHHHPTHSHIPKVLPYPPYHHPTSWYVLKVPQYPPPQIILPPHPISNHFNNIHHPPLATIPPPKTPPYPPHHTPSSHTSRHSQTIHTDRSIILALSHTPNHLHTHHTTISPTHPFTKHPHTHHTTISHPLVLNAPPVLNAPQTVLVGSILVEIVLGRLCIPPWSAICV